MSVVTEDAQPSRRRSDQNPWYAGIPVWVTLLISLVGILLSAGVAWGAFGVRVSDLEDARRVDLAQRLRDEAEIATVRAEHAALKNDVTEVKNDVKWLVRNAGGPATPPTGSAK